MDIESYGVLVIRHNGCEVWVTAACALIDGTPATLDDAYKALTTEKPQ